jgi:DNA polymerase-1
MEKRIWGVDTETTGLSHVDDKVLLVQIGDKDNQYLIDTRMTNIEPLRPFFESNNHAKIGHNLKLDYKMIKSNFGIDMERPRDTFLAEKILFNGAKFDGFSLKDCMDSHLGIKMDKNLQKSFIDHQGPFSNAQLEYAANDVKHLETLLMRQCDGDGKEFNGLRKDKLYDTWILESNCIPCFGDMEVHGLSLAKDKWREIFEENLSQAKKLATEMDELAKPYCSKINLWGEPEINYGSPDQVLKLMHRMELHVTERDFSSGRTVHHLPLKSDDATLKKMGQYPFVRMLQDYRSYMVMYGTFGESFIKAVHPKTGRIHPLFHQIGTETGRPATASDSPVNMLNIPRDKRMRNCFVAPEDYVIETDDFSGCELRIWAHLSQDPQLCQALQEGKDLHCYVASKLYGKPVSKTENAELRTPAKSLNFGRPVG